MTRRPHEAALGALADDQARNATLAAIGQALPPRRRAGREQDGVPFSSARKWSAASYAGHGTWVLGAPEIVLAGPAGEAAAAGGRGPGRPPGSGSSTLAHTAEDPWNGQTPPARPCTRWRSSSSRSNSRPEHSPDPSPYFAAQGVALKVISGDSPRTVGAVAARAGACPRPAIPSTRGPACRQDPAALGHRAFEEHSRLRPGDTPSRKEAMVKALQARGHTVAMTGNGVNDVLALKLADIGVAMGTGAPATKAVAELVLLDDRFATPLPGVVAEGRQVTANIERVANLYITKTVWATLLAVAAGIALMPYPFLPGHLTHHRHPGHRHPLLLPRPRAQPPPLRARVRRPGPADSPGPARTPSSPPRRSRPTPSPAARGLLPLTEQRTAATLVTLILSLTVLALLAMPLTWRRVALLVAALAAFVLLVPVTAVRRFYALALPHGAIAGTLLIAALGVVALAGFWIVSRRLGRGPAEAVPG